MELQIIEKTEEAVTLLIGKKEFFIMNTGSYINVICKNAAHFAYNGMGKFFDTWEQAENGYKSSEAKEAIRTASELLK